MTASLQQRLALVALVGILLVPVLATNMRGLTHLLTCSEDVTQQFAVQGLGDQDAMLTSSTVVERDGAVGANDLEVVQASGGQLCDALRVDVSARATAADRVELTVALTNDSELPWSGTVGLAAAGTEVGGGRMNASVGRVEPGERASTTLRLRVPAGQTEIGGTLLLGP